MGGYGFSLLACGIIATATLVVPTSYAEGPLPEQNLPGGMCICYWSEEGHAPVWDRYGRLGVRTEEGGSPTESVYYGLIYGDLPDLDEITCLKEAFEDELLDSGIGHVPDFDGILDECL